MRTARPRVSLRLFEVFPPLNMNRVILFSILFVFIRRYCKDSASKHNNKKDNVKKCLKDYLADFDVSDGYAIRWADKQCQQVLESCILAP